MASQVYNTDHWAKQIKKYQSQEWSFRPSLFVQEVNKHIPANSNVLELGSGAGQDGIWLAKQGHKITLSDATDLGFDELRNRLKKEQVSADLLDFEITKKWPVKDESLDCVYAQLVLHYFNDETMKFIFAEITRVLKPGGVLACLVNSTKDSEFDSASVNDDGLIEVNGLSKRFFSVESFKPFTIEFKPIIFDDQGRTPKDDAIGNSGLIQFIGTKND